MAKEEVSAKKGTGEDAPSATVLYEFGENLDSAVALYGADCVFKQYKKATTVDVQAGIRRCLETGKIPQDFADKYKPGQRAEGVAIDPLQAAKIAMQNMDPEARKAFLAELKGAAK